MNGIRINAWKSERQSKVQMYVKQHNNTGTYSLKNITAPPGYAFNYPKVEFSIYSRLKIKLWMWCKSWIREATHLYTLFHICLFCYLSIIH